MDKYKNTYRIKSHRKPNWDYSSNGLYFLTIVTQNMVRNLGKINEQNEMELSDFGKIVNTEWHKSFEIRNELFLDEFIIMPNHLHAIIEIYNDKKMGDLGGNNGGDIGNDIGGGDDGGDLCNINGGDNCGNNGDNNGGDIGGDNGDDIGGNIDGGNNGGNLGNINGDDIGDDIGGNLGGDNGGDLGDDGVQTHGRVSLANNPPNPDNPHPSPLINISSIKRMAPIRLPKSISSFMGGFKSAVNTKIDDYIDDHKLTMPKFNRNNHFFQPNYHDHIIQNNNEYWAIKNYIKNNPKKWRKDKLK